MYSSHGVVTHAIPGHSYAQDFTGLRAQTKCPKSLRVDRSKRRIRGANRSTLALSSRTLGGVDEKPHNPELRSTPKGVPQPPTHDVIESYASMEGHSARVKAAGGALAVSTLGAGSASAATGAFAMTRGPSYQDIASTDSLSSLEGFFSDAASGPVLVYPREANLPPTVVDSFSSMEGVPKTVSNAAREVASAVESVVQNTSGPVLVFPKETSPTVQSYASMEGVPATMTSAAVSTPQEVASAVESAVQNTSGPVMVFPTVQSPPIAQSSTTILEGASPTLNSAAASVNEAAGASLIGKKSIENIVVVGAQNANICDDLGTIPDQQLLDLVSSDPNLAGLTYGQLCAQLDVGQVEKLNQSLASSGFVSSVTTVPPPAQPTTSCGLLFQELCDDLAGAPTTSDTVAGALVTGTEDAASRPAPFGWSMLEDLALQLQAQMGRLAVGKQVDVKVPALEGLSEAQQAELMKTMAGVVKATSGAVPEMSLGGLLSNPGGFSSAYPLQVATVAVVLAFFIARAKHVSDYNKGLAAPPQPVTAPTTAATPAPYAIPVTMSFNAIEEKIRLDPLEVLRTQASYDEGDGTFDWGDEESDWSLEPAGQTTFSVPADVPDFFAPRSAPPTPLAPPVVAPIAVPVMASQHSGLTPSMTVEEQAAVETYFESVLRKQMDLEAAEQKEARPPLITPSLYASTQRQKAEFKENIEAIQGLLKELLLREVAQGKASITQAETFFQDQAADKEEQWEITTPRGGSRVVSVKVTRDETSVVIKADKPSLVDVSFR